MLARLMIVTCLLASAGSTSTAANAEAASQLAQARVSLRAGDWGEAMDLAEKVTEDYPDHAQAWFVYAQAIRVKMTSVSQARALFSIDDYREALGRAIELDPGHAEARREEIGFLIQAPGIAGGDLDEAERKIAALEGHNPAYAWEMRALLAMAREDPDAALHARMKVIELLPDEAGPRMQMAFTLMQLERFKEAEPHLVIAQQSAERADQLNALYQRGRWRVLAGEELDVAAALYLQYIDEEFDDSLNVPDKGAAYWRLGLAREGQGDIVQAYAMVQRSVELNDEFEPARDDLKRLKRALGR